MIHNLTAFIKVKSKFLGYQNSWPIYICKKSEIFLTELFDYS